MATPSTPLTFSTLWDNYPDDPPCVDANGDKIYDDQCAIKLGTALAKSGVSFDKFPGPRCMANPPKNNGMVLRAEELATWLKSRPFKDCPAVRILTTGKGFQTALHGQTGIIFFKDYWYRKNNGKEETSPTGDHIDLWRRDRLTPSFETFLRFSLGIGHVRNLLHPLSPHNNWYSNLEDAKQVWFWAIS